MSKLKTAIEKKDWLTAKRLILDNQEFLEENVDFLLENGSILEGIMERYCDFQKACDNEDCSVDFVSRELLRYIISNGFDPVKIITGEEKAIKIKPDTVTINVKDQKSRQVDKEKIFERMEKEGGPVYHHLMHKFGKADIQGKHDDFFDQCRNFTNAPEDEVKPLFRKATLDSIRKQFGDRHEDLDDNAKLLSEALTRSHNSIYNPEDIDEDGSPAESISEKVDKRQAEMFSGKPNFMPDPTKGPAQYEEWKRIILGDQDDPNRPANSFPELVRDQELAHEQAIRINEDKKIANKIFDLQHICSWKPERTSESISEKVDKRQAEMFSELNENFIINDGDIPTDGRVFTVGKYGIDPASPGGDKSSSVLMKDGKAVCDVKTDLTNLNTDIDKDD